MKLKGNDKEVEESGCQGHQGGKYLDMVTVAQGQLCSNMELISLMHPS